MKKITKGVKLFNQIEHLPPAPLQYLEAFEVQEPLTIKFEPCSTTAFRELTTILKNEKVNKE